MTKIKGITVLINDNKEELNDTIAEQVQLMEQIEKDARAIRLELLRLRLDDIRVGLLDDLFYHFDEPELAIQIAEVVAGYK